MATSYLSKKLTIDDIFKERIVTLKYYFEKQKRLSRKVV